MIVVLHGLMSSKGGTSAGGVTGHVTDSELAEICQQSHMSVMGCNNRRAKGEDIETPVDPSKDPLPFNEQMTA